MKSDVSNMKKGTPWRCAFLSALAALVAVLILVLVVLIGLILVVILILVLVLVIHVLFLQKSTCGMTAGLVCP